VPKKERVVSTEGNNVRGVGTLWGEWSNLDQYPAGGFYWQTFWMSDTYDSDRQYTFFSKQGNLGFNEKLLGVNVLCYVSL
jgi:hypothetical protein